MLASYRILAGALRLHDPERLTVDTPENVVTKPVPVAFGIPVTGNSRSCG